MEKTTNLGLLKPAQEDFYNVDDFNANCDILDNAIKTNDDNAVHKSGNEIIDGVKTFKKAIVSSGIVSDDTSRSLVLSGGTNSASLTLDGKDSNNGAFSLQANDGTNDVALFGDTKGNLIWNGQNIIRSINGVEADTNGNINLDDTTDSYVLKSGDTVNGTLTFSTINAINCNVDTQRIDIYGGITWLRGGGVSVIGKGATENAGNFDVWASDGANHKHLVGKPNGELTWDLKHVVRSVNGVQADNKGNVTLDLGISLLKTWSSKDGSWGYRIWSDGYCDQWGKEDISIATNTRRIPIATPFKDTSYNVLFFVTDNQIDNSNCLITLYNKSTSYFTVANHLSNWVGGYHWRCCGYVDLTTI